MKTLSATLRSVLVLLALGIAASPSMHAQLPVNDVAWKDRCELLAASANSIQSATPPAALVSLTHGVPAHGFFVLAVDRAQAGQHFVACTMYFLAALADRAGNGGMRDPLMAANYATIGGSEDKLAHGHHLNMHEHVIRVKMKVEEMTGKPLSLTPPETSAVLDASTTMPVSLTR